MALLLVDNKNSFDPSINLAIEDFLVRHVDCSEHDYLFLYINEPCIVVGKNQSIYKEVNFEFLRNDKLKLCRRISGGGTVYQDKGNLNFAFISKFDESKVNNYKYFNQPIVEALNKAGVEASMDSRNNILCKGKKISGNAQFTNRKTIISHGTLLFDADLETLRSALRENDFEVESKAVSSVRSSVMNLKGESRQIASVEELKIYLQQELKTENVYHFTNEQWGEIEKLAEEKFKSFEWIYGRSPKTIIRKEEMEIEVDDGVITQITNSKSQTGNLIGVRYEWNEIKKVVGELSALYFFTHFIFLRFGSLLL